MTNPLPDLPDLAAVVAWLNEQRLTQPSELHRRLTQLEARMATTDEQIAALTANQTIIQDGLLNIQGDITNLKAQLDAVQGELTQVDPVLAAKLQPAVDQATALADQITALAAATPEPPTP